jgi:hypothetical protein
VSISKGDVREAAAIKRLGAHIVLRSLAGRTNDPGESRRMAHTVLSWAAGLTEQGSYGAGPAGRRVSNGPHFRNCNARKQPLARVGSDA